jgi:hypothetical protein
MFDSTTNEWKIVIEILLKKEDVILMFFRFNNLLYALDEHDAIYYLNNVKE